MTASKQHPPGAAGLSPVHHILPALLWAEEGQSDHHRTAVSRKTANVMSVLLLALLCLVCHEHVLTSQAGGEGQS